jgi:hypothetical protein
MNFEMADPKHQTLLTALSASAVTASAIFLYQFVTKRRKIKAIKNDISLSISSGSGKCQ